MKTEQKTVIYVDHGYEPHLALVAYSRPEVEFGPVEPGQAPPDRLTLGYFMARAQGLLMAGNIHAAFRAEFDVKHGSNSFHDRQEVIPGAKFSNGQINGSDNIQLEKPGGFYLEIGEEVPAQRVEKLAVEKAAEDLDAVADDAKAAGATATVEAQKTEDPTEHDSEKPVTIQ